MTIRPSVTEGSVSAGVSYEVAHFIVVCTNGQRLVIRAQKVCIAGAEQARRSGFLVCRVPQALVVLRPQTLVVLHPLLFYFHSYPPQTLRELKICRLLGGQRDEKAVDRHPEDKRYRWQEPVTQAVTTVRLPRNVMLDPTIRHDRASTPAS